MSGYIYGGQKKIKQRPLEENKSPLQRSGYEEYSRQRELSVLRSSGRWRGKVKRETSEEWSTREEVHEERGKNKQRRVDHIVGSGQKNGSIPIYAPV